MTTKKTSGARASMRVGWGGASTDVLSEDRSAEKTAHHTSAPNLNLPVAEAVQTTADAPQWRLPALPRALNGIQSLLQS